MKIAIDISDLASEAVKAETAKCLEKAFAALGDTAAAAFQVNDILHAAGKQWRVVSRSWSLDTPDPEVPQMLTLNLHQKR